jgi:hypothetical protein
MRSKDSILSEASLLSYDEIRNVLATADPNVAPKDVVDLHNLIISIAITEFHFFILQAHQLIALSRLNESVVQVANLRLCHMQIYYVHS